MVSSIESTVWAFSPAPVLMISQHIHSVLSPQSIQSKSFGWHLYTSSYRWSAVRDVMGFIEPFRLPPTDSPSSDTFYFQRKGPRSYLRVDLAEDCHCLLSQFARMASQIISNAIQVSIPLQGLSIDQLELNATISSE